MTLLIFHFLLYNNSSTDQGAKIIGALITGIIIHLIVRRKNRRNDQN